MNKPILKFFIYLVIVSILVVVEADGHSQTSGMSPESADWGARIEQIHSGTWEMKPCFPTTLACFGDKPATLQAFLRKFTVSEINRTHGDRDTLLRELAHIDTAAFAKQLRRNGNDIADPNPQTDGPFFFQNNLGANQVIITVNSFPLGATALPSDLVVIQGFRKEGELYTYADQTGDGMFGILEYKQCKVLGTSGGRLWLLAQGQVAGYMGDLERVRLYSFDGYQFKEELAPKDHLNTEVVADASQITMQYMDKVYEPSYAETCTVEKRRIQSGQLLEVSVMKTADEGGCSAQ